MLIAVKMIPHLYKSVDHAAQPCAFAPQIAGVSDGTYITALPSPLLKQGSTTK